MSAIRLRTIIVAAVASMMACTTASAQWGVDQQQEFAGACQDICKGQAPAPTPAQCSLLCVCMAAEAEKTYPDADYFRKAFLGRDTGVMQWLEVTGASCRQNVPQ